MGESDRQGGLLMPTVRLGLVTLPLAGLLATWANIAGSYPSGLYRCGSQSWGGRSGLQLPWLLLKPVLGLCGGPDAADPGHLRANGLPGGVARREMGVGCDDSEHSGYRSVALALRPPNLRPPSAWGSLPKRSGECCRNGQHYLRQPGGERLLRTFLLYSAGFILFGFAVWGARTLPGWAGVLLALHAPLFSGPLPELFSVLGALLLLSGGGWVAYAVLRKPRARVVPETKETRARSTKESRARTVTRLRRTGTEQRERPPGRQQTPTRATTHRGNKLA